LLQLLRAPGYPAEDDQVILNVTEFWIEYAEQIADTVMDSPEDEIPFLEVVRTDLMQAVQIYIPKLQAPPLSEMSEWDEDNVDQWQLDCTVGREHPGTFSTHRVFVVQ
jgi:hypothetical protein